jgi:hypothetical protein
MATMAKTLLSGGGSEVGGPIKVAATDITSSPTVIHTGSASNTAHIDLMTVYLYNGNTAAELVVLKLAGSTDYLKFSVNPNESILALDQIPLKGHGSTGYKLEAASDTANKVLVTGSVTTIR